MNLIFLDIDGVLNSHRSAFEYDGFGSFNQPWKLDPVAITLLRRLTEAANAQLVLSSSWRYAISGPEQLASWMAMHGWPDAPVHGMTRCKSEGEVRGDVIKDYVDEHKPECYVILDNDSDMLENQERHFVHVDAVVGFSHENMLEAIDGFNVRDMFNQQMRDHAAR